MRAQQIGRLRWWGGMKRGARQDLLALDRRLEQAVFFSRKAVSGRKRQLLYGGEEETHVAIPSICGHKNIPVWHVGELSTRSTAYVTIPVPVCTDLVVRGCVPAATCLSETPR